MAITGKAVLLSALVCPGAGHIFLKKYRFGGLLISITLIVFGFILVDAINGAGIIADQIINGQIGSDVESIRQAVMSRPKNKYIPIAYFVLIAIWITGIIDSYRLSKNLSES